MENWMYYPRDHPSAGFLNVPAWLTHDPANWRVAVGGRQIGKTYGVMEHIHNTLMQPYIYIRTTERQQVMSMSEKSNFFQEQKRKQEELGLGGYSWADSVTIVDGGDNTPTYIYDTRYEEGKLPIGIATSLQGMRNLKGIAFSLYKHIIFDEFIEPKNSGARKNRGFAFMDAYFTINSNRERFGLKPVTVWLLANAVNVADDVPIYLRITEQLLRMAKKRQVYSYQPERDISIIFPSDSPISAAMRRTSAYKLLGANHEYMSMAIDSDFAWDDDTGVKSCPIKEYNLIGWVDGVGVYRHKSSGGIYCVDGTKKPAENAYDTHNATHRKAAKAWWAWNAVTFPVDGVNIFYSNYTAKVIVYGLLGLDTLKK